MARFDSYRNLLKNFKKEIEGVYSKQSDEIEYVNKNYKPEAAGNAVKNVKAEYAPSFLAIRKNYLNKLNDVTEALKKKNSSKYIDNYVNKPFLETLNLIAAAGIPLTTSELEYYCTEAMKSRSHFCVRKVQDLAKKSNCKMTVPDEKRANEIIDKADKRISGIIHGYDGNPTFSPSNFEPLRDTGIAMDAGGRFLDQLESEYTDTCVEDITITSIEPEKEGEEPTELVETGHLGIKVEEIRESYASKYAEKYSAERMAEKAGNADGLE